MDLSNFMNMEIRLDLDLTLAYFFLATIFLFLIMESYKDKTHLRVIWVVKCSLLLGAFSLLLSSRIIFNSQLLAKSGILFIIITLSGISKLSIFYPLEEHKKIRKNKVSDDELTRLLMNYPNE